MPRTLVLHIGVHKTGTTAIQRACIGDRRALARQGWTVVRPQRGPINWGDGFEWIAPANTVRLSAPRLAAMQAGLAGAGQNAILSAEDLFFLEDDEIARFAEAVRGGFGRVRILVWLRRQDELAVSQKAQAAKSIKAGEVFGLDAARLPEVTPFLRGYLSFDTRLAAWQRAFPGAEMVVGVYDRAAFAGGSAVGAFADAVGVRIAPGRADENVTLGANAVRLLVGLRAAGAPPRAVKRVIDLGLIAPDATPFLPTRDSARAFLGRFAASNRALGARFGVGFSDDFSRYPETLAADDFAAYERDTLLKLLPEFGQSARRDADVGALRAQLCAAMRTGRPRRGLARLFGG